MNFSLRFRLLRRFAAVKFLTFCMVFCTVAGKVRLLRFYEQVCQKFGKKITAFVLFAKKAFCLRRRKAFKKFQSGFLFMGNVSHQGQNGQGKQMQCHIGCREVIGVGNFSVFQQVAENETKHCQTQIQCRRKADRAFGKQSGLEHAQFRIKKKDGQQNDGLHHQTCFYRVFRIAVDDGKQAAANDTAEQDHACQQGFSILLDAF